MNYFSNLDLEPANSFQREASGRIVALFDRLKPVGVEAERTRAWWTDQKRMLWLRAPNEKLQGFDLEIVVEESTMVINIWRASEHFGYEDRSESAIDSALPFVEATLQGRVVLEVARRGPFLASISITALDLDGSILSRTTQPYLAGTLFFLPKRVTTIAPFGT